MNHIMDAVFKHEGDFFLLFVYYSWPYLQLNYDRVYLKHF